MQIPTLKLPASVGGGGGGGGVGNECVFLSMQRTVKVLLMPCGYAEADIKKMTRSLRYHDAAHLKMMPKYIVLRDNWKIKLSTYRY